MKREDFFKNKDNIIAIIGIVFLVTLAMFARFDTTSNESNKDNNDNNDTIEKENQNNQEEIEEESYNYEFNYTIDNNKKISIIEGKTYNNKQKFSIIEDGVKKEYAKLEDNYLRLENGQYEILTTDINDYFKYLDLDDIQEFVDYSIYDEDEHVKTYQIDITDLIDKYNIETEYDSFSDFKDDSITVEESNGKLKKIVLDYSNYFSYITNSTYTFKVTMNFNRYGKVEDFDI